MEVHIILLLLLEFYTIAGVAYILTDSTISCRNDTIKSIVKRWMNHIGDMYKDKRGLGNITVTPYALITIWIYLHMLIIILVYKTAYKIINTIKWRRG